VTVAGDGRGVRVDHPAALLAEDLRLQTGGTALTLVGARHAELSGVRADAATDALVVEASQDVVVRGSELRAVRNAVRVADSRDVVLDGVATAGAVRGPVTRGGPGRSVSGAAGSPGTASAVFSPWSPVR